jgi:hypothetical protein
MSHANADIALTVDGAGGGKTTAARWYAERDSRSAILLNETARQLGVETRRVNQTVLIQNMADALAERNMVGIFDEAD